MENHRFLTYSDGKPFFWLGDTGWLLFSKLTREEAEKYLENRAKKRIQCDTGDGFARTESNQRCGDSALSNADVSQLAVTSGNSDENSTEYDFWDHIDFIIGRAEEKEIYMALVPVGLECKKR